MLIALLEAHGQQLPCIPGRIVHHAAATYRGDGKTDAKDARIIADQARMRTDLLPVCAPDEVAVGLRLPASHRLDVIHDRVRAINRLRAALMEYLPALERSFDFSKNKAALTLLSDYSTPQGIRSMGVIRLTAWLQARGCRNSAGVALKAIEAAKAQDTVLPCQSVASILVAKLAETIRAIDDDVASIDARIHEQRSLHHVSAYDLTCRCAYDLMCRSVSGVS